MQGKQRKGLTQKACDSHEQHALVSFFYDKNYIYFNALIPKNVKEPCVSFPLVPVILQFVQMAWPVITSSERVRLFTLMVKTLPGTDRWDLMGVPSASTR